MSQEPKKKTKNKAGAPPAPPTPAAPAPIVLHPKPHNFKAQLTEGATSIMNNGKNYEFQMDARDFGPSDVTLTIDGGKKIVRIDAYKETEEEEAETSFEIEIPLGVDPALLEAAMNKKGVLRITAPITLLPAVATESKAIVVRSEKRTETVVKTVRSEVTEEVVETHFFEVDPPAKDVEKFEDVSESIVKSESGNGFKLDFDLPVGTNKDDITVNVYPTMATVQVKPNKDAAKQEPGKLQVEICKKVQLPKQTRNKTLTSVMNVENGRFSITGLLKTPTAPKEKKTEPEKVFEVKRIPPPTPKVQPGSSLPVIVDSNANLDVEDAKDGQDVSEEVVKDFDAYGNKFETKLDISGWPADQIEVKALKKVVTVRTRTTVKSTEETSSSSLTQSSQFKLFKIPPRVRQGDLKAVLASDNELKISSVLQPLSNITPKVLPDDSFKVSAVGKGAPVAAKDFKHVLDLTGYEPEQIEVSIRNGWIWIKAKQVSSVFVHNFQARAFSRKLTIPPGIKPEDIRVALDPLTSTLFISAAASA